MKYKRRSVQAHLKELCDYFPVVAVLGARQVGKTTLIQHLFEKEYKTVTFDPAQDVGQARQDPDLFLANHPEKLFLDEVQYAPELLSAIKRSVDKNRQPGRFILSGSQNLSVVKNIAESLAGRVAILELPPLSFKELTNRPEGSFLQEWVQKNTFTPAAAPENPPWNKTIFRGGLPGTIDLPDHLLDRFFEGYVQTYIERDIRSVADIGNLQLFSRFYRLLSALSATEINHSELGRDLSIDRRTAAAWKNVLESTYQWKEIPAFSRNAVKRIASKSKGIFTDAGMLCHLQRITSPELIAGHPLQGRIVETWVINEIFKICSAWDHKPAFYHYRTAAGAEVDLILELNGQLHPIEIKAKTNPSKRDTLGLRSFQETFPKENTGRGLVICGCEEPMQIAPEILAIPWHRLS